MESRRSSSSKQLAVKDVEVSRTTSINLTIAFYDVCSEGNTKAVRRIGARLFNKTGGIFLQRRAQVATLRTPIQGFVQI